MKINITDKKREPILDELEEQEKTQPRYRTPKVKSIPRKNKFLPRYKPKNRKYTRSKRPNVQRQEKRVNSLPSPSPVNPDHSEPEPNLSIEQLEELLAKRKQKELEMKQLQESQLQILALEQERKRLEEEKVRIENELKAEKIKEEQERLEFLKQELLVPLIPINIELFDSCPICKNKTKKSKVKKIGNLVTQEIKCKNKLCNFQKIVNLEV